MSGEPKIRVTVTLEYVPEPESYEYPAGGVGELEVAEMARQDEALWHDRIIGIDDVLEWGDIISVDFSAVDTASVRS